jgi:type 1 glutamine amidotransferase
MTKPRPSRRRFLSTAPVAAGAAFCSVSGAESEPAEKVALALIGDRYHNADYIRVALDRVFKSLNIPIEYTIQYDAISGDLLQKYRLLLCLRDGMIWPDGYLGPDAYSCYEQGLEDKEAFPEPQPRNWISEEQGAAIRDFVKAGNGFYALHNSSHISLSSKEYRDVMGGAYVGHPDLRPFRVRPVGTHPITQGIGEFIVNDEQHYVDYDKDRQHIILESENLDGLNYENHGTKSIAGWAHEYGKGRVVFTAVGHTIHALWNPQYVQLQQQAVRWLLKQI